MRLKSETADIILEVTMQNYMYVGQLTKAHRIRAKFSMNNSLGLQAHRHLDPTFFFLLWKYKIYAKKIKCNSAKFEFNTKIYTVIKKPEIG